MLTKVQSAIKIAKLRKNGIKIPVIVYQEAVRAKIPVAALAAMIEQETHGDNVYGHDSDPTTHRPIWHGQNGRVPVTKENYAHYKRWRISNHNRLMQGVGPTQLTWYAYQDEADKIGGCWDPRCNVRIGAQILRDHYRNSRNWEKVFTEYNGSPAYGKQVNLRMKKWQKILGNG